MAAGSVNHFARLAPTTFHAKSPLTFDAMIVEGFLVDQNGLD